MTHPFTAVEYKYDGHWAVAFLIGTADQEKIAEVFSWCVDQFGNATYWGRNEGPWSHNDGIFLFNDMSMATVFKMKWPTIKGMDYRNATMPLP